MDIFGEIMSNQIKTMKFFKMKHRKHWYRQYFGCCPVCGRDKSYKERVYGKRPGIKKRWIHLSDFETYDHCVG